MLPVLTARVPRQAQAGDIDAIAGVFRTSRLQTMPYLPLLHTLEEDRTYFRTLVYEGCTIWVVDAAGQIAGFCAVRPGWIDHLYVLPAFQRTGIGRTLVSKAMEAADELQLWVFQRNRNAVAFYEALGFSCVRRTSGSDNEEREPDVLLQWVRHQPAS